MWLKTKHSYRIFLFLSFLAFPSVLHAGIINDLWFYNASKDQKGSLAKKIHSEVRSDIKNNSEIFWYAHQLAEVYWKLWEVEKNGDWFVQHIVYLDKGARFPDTKLNRQNLAHEKKRRNYFKIALLNYAEGAHTRSSGLCHPKFKVCFFKGDNVNILTKIYEKALKGK
jgi:hypothetical protein